MQNPQSTENKNMHYRIPPPDLETNHYQQEDVGQCQKRFQHDTLLIAVIQYVQCKLDQQPSTKPGN